MLKKTASFLLAGLLCAGILSFVGFGISFLPFEIQQNANGKEALEQVLLDADALKQSDNKSSKISKSLFSMLPLSPFFPEKEAYVIASMIENHEDARPFQAGLQNAEIVFEMIVEGDISRFLAIFRSDKLPETIGPVRSLRPHFISVLRGYQPLLLHIGGSSLAYEMVRSTNQIVNHDGIRYDGETYHRENSAEAPHNLFMGKEALEGVITKYEKNLRKETFPLYPVSRKKPKGEEAKTIELFFGGPLHDVTFAYKPMKGEYKRSIHNADVQATPANILVLQVEIQGYNSPGSIPWTRTFGEGEAFFFRNGVKTDAIWKREKQGTFEFLDSAGQPLQFARGQIWITMLPYLEEQVSWE